MTESDVDTLKEELDHFREEKERVRAIVGKIGGTATVKRDKIINTIFIVAIACLFVFDLLRHAYHIPMGNLPPVFSLELGVLLVSVKIVWMLHKQTKVEHFQFWVLNSIEFRLNELSRRFGELAKDVKTTDEAQPVGQ